MLSRKFLDNLLEREGGFVDHPKDPGGATNMGITIKTAEEYININSLSIPDVRLYVVELTSNQASDIYNWLFERSGAHLLELEDLQELFFDSCVLQGTSRTVRWLQDIVDTVQDGILGPITAEAANEEFSCSVYASLLSRRFSHVAEITVKRPDKFLVFLEGWVNRLKEFIR